MEALILQLPFENARKLLPYLRNGKLVVLAEIGHVSDVENIQPEAYQHLVERFYLEGIVDDSKFAYQPMNFIPSETFQDIAKQFVAQANQGAARPASAEILPYLSSLSGQSFVLSLRAEHTDEPPFSYHSGEHLDEIRWVAKRN